MSTETQVAPAAETQTTAADLTPEAPGVVTQETTSDDGKTPTEATESEESKALKRMQRRIDKRTADVYRERAEKEQLAQRIADLEARLQPADDTQPEPRALSEKEVQSRAEQRAREIASQEALQRSVDTVLKAGKSLEGFTAACNTLNDELPFYDRQGRPTPFLAAVLEFDAPAQLLHHLGTNPDLAAELADMTPTRQIRRLDAIERELTDKAKPKTSAAPKPLEPVKSTGGGTKEPSEMSYAEFKAWRAQTIKQRR